MFLGVFTALAGCEEEYRSIALKIDDEIYEGEPSACEYNGAYYIPLTSMAEALDFEVEWIPETKTAVVKSIENIFADYIGEERQLYITVGSGDVKIVWPDFSDSEIDSFRDKPFIYESKIMVPVSIIGVFYDCMRFWSESENTYTFKTKDLPWCRA